MVVMDILSEKLDLAVELEHGSEEIDPKDIEAPAFQIVEILCKGFGMIATRKLFPGDLILAEKPIFIVPGAVYEDVESTEEFLDKEIHRVSSEERELFLS